jgi:hypothetical protein
MTDSAYERDVMAIGSDQTASEKLLVLRLARNRREGWDTTQDVQELLKLAARANQAALERLIE